MIQQLNKTGLYPLCCGSVAQLCLTLCNPLDSACQVSLSLIIARSLLKLMSIELVMPSNHRFLCCPLLLLPSVFPSIRVFSSESTLCIRWSKYWSFSFSISPLHEYSGLISFRTDHTLGSPRDSKESSPTPQFESINSFLFLSLSFLYGPTLTSTHDYWKNHSFDYTDLCWQTNVSGFLICCLGLSQLFFQGTSISTHQMSVVSVPGS